MAHLMQFYNMFQSLDVHAMTDSHVIFNTPYEKVMESMRLGFFDLLHTGVSLLDKNGNFGYCNAAFIRMYGLPDDVVGRNVKEFFLVNDDDFVRHLFERKMVISIGESTNHVCGVLFSYVIYDDNREFCGFAIESIPCDLSREKLGELIESMQSLEMKTISQRMGKKPASRDLHTFAGMIGESAAMRAMRHLGTRFAASDQPVLISGESGTGKELVARALHNASPRAKEPFISVNCAALPAELTESELFGYEGGAFTGARSGGMKGKFEQANGGTIFLDEIGELPLSIQAKLLRVLENGEIQKIGCRNALHSNFRLIGATNRDLLQMIRISRFREDLYHRLSVFELNVPPLREREDDIFLLTRFYLDQYLDGDQSVWLDKEMEMIFRNYSWPGNIRELKNTLVYALYALGAGQKVVDVSHLPQRFLKFLRRGDLEGGARVLEEHVEKSAKPGTGHDLPHNMSEVELLKSTLEKLRYNKALTARELGMSRSKLYRILNKYGLND